MKRRGFGLYDLLDLRRSGAGSLRLPGAGLWMLITAVKPPDEWLTTPPILVPSELHWANFTDALFTWGGAKGLEDSLIVASLSTLLSLAHRGSRRLRPRPLQYRRRELVLHRAQHPVHAAGRDRHSDVSILVDTRAARQLHCV